MSLARTPLQIENSLLSCFTPVPLVMIFCYRKYMKLRDASNIPQLQRNISCDKPNLLPPERLLVTTLSHVCLLSISIWTHIKAWKAGVRSTDSSVTLTPQQIAA